MANEGPSNVGSQSSGTPLPNPQMPNSGPYSAPVGPNTNQGKERPSK